MDGREREGEGRESYVDVDSTDCAGEIGVLLGMGD